jgi:hypothetical protein
MMSTEYKQIQQNKEHGTVVMKTTKSHSVRLWSDNFLSNWFFLWVTPIISSARRKQPLMFGLRTKESARVNVDLLDAAWTQEAQSAQPSILRALFVVFGYEYIAIAGYKLWWTFFTWAGAWYLLKLFLQFLSLTPEEDLKGHSSIFFLTP